MVRRPALPTPIPPPKAMMGEAEVTELCRGLATMASVPVPKAGDAGILKPVLETKKGHVSPPALLPELCHPRPQWPCSLRHCGVWDSNSTSPSGGL